VPAPTPVPQALGRLDPPDVEAVRALVEQVTRADGTPPLSEHVLLHLPRGGDARGRNVLVREGGSVLAYAHLDTTDTVEGSSAELTVAPSARGRGLGRALVEQLLSQSPDGRLRLWAHGDAPAAAALAGGLGFRRSRVLLQMRRPLTGELPPVVLPSGVALRTFATGDEKAWLTLNNLAFADHPDQGGWTPEDVAIRMREPWFDAKGFLLAERDGALVGSHWTKVHGGHGGADPHEHAEGEDHGPGHHRGGDAEHDHHDHPPIGEVYIVAVHPSEQGRGLGPAVTLAGLHSLQGRGLTSVLLYVDESNTAAVRVYERLGFSRHAVDVMYSRP